MLNVPSHDYRRSDYRVPPRLHTGLDALVNRFIGQYERRASRLADLRREVEIVVSMEREWMELKDAELQHRFLEIREKFRRGGKLADELVLPALAGLREAAHRQLGLRPFPVQLMGALALHRGY